MSPVMPPYAALQSRHLTRIACCGGSPLASSNSCRHGTDFLGDSYSHTMLCDKQD